MFPTPRLLYVITRLDVTYYNYEFTDLQVNTFNPTKFSYVLSNAGSVKQQGVDFQVGLRPTRAINLHGALGWNHNRFGSFVGQCFTGQTAAQGCNVLPGPAQDFAGRPTARSPEWSGNAGAVYTVPIHGFELSISGDTFYSAGYFASETLSPASYQSAFWRYNASIRLTQPDSGWSLGVVGRNLSNKYYITLAADRTGGRAEQRGAVARGREIALEGSLHL